MLSLTLLYRLCWFPSGPEPPHVGWAPLELPCEFFNGAEELLMNRGKNLVINGRRVGKHDATIAMVSSKYDQRAASVLSQVESSEVAAA